MNIKFCNKLISFFTSIALLRDSFCYFSKSFANKRARFVLAMKALCLGIGIATGVMSMVLYHVHAYSSHIVNEPVQACVMARNVDLTNEIRAKFAQCLGWQADQSSPICLGSYQPVIVTPLANPDEVRIQADSVSFYPNQRSTLSGNVEIQQAQNIVNAQTAYVYRDPKSNQVTKIELLGNVRYLEPGKIMIARKATINPQDKSGQTEDVLYRINTNRSKASLPAWGRASLIQRFANKDYLLRQATYTTCAPQDKAWNIQADSIKIDNAKGKGVARNAVVKVNEWPVFYTPYLSFPTTKERKSGFLMPIAGSSNVGGAEFGLPYYWNMAPNYDMTLVPQVYTDRGFMMGGEFRYLTTNSSGIFTGNFLPKDKAFNNFMQQNVMQFPQLQGLSTDRWYYGVLDTTNFTPNLQLNVNAQQVSDDYYLQDFSSNLAQITQRQLLSQADLTYSTENWIFKGMGQSYQTLHPINETPIASVYDRLPQLMAHGHYYDLPFNANLNILGQYDQFHWQMESWDINAQQVPQGPRFHFNPILNVPLIKSWGYISPSVQFVENYYEVNHNVRGFKSNPLDMNRTNPNFIFIDNNHNVAGTHDMSFNRTIPRYSVDSGLFFERDFNFSGNAYMQTLEPRLFYLNVPYQNQTPIPVYDSGFMIFNADQLFRTNRFSGFDRIGDANQLTYALTSRWLSADTGSELATFSIGQIKYFSDRKVQLCQNPSGFCIDNPATFGYLSYTSETSPIASRASYHFNPAWGITGDYIWDPATHATNNGDLNLHYQPSSGAIINFGYSYLVNGDITQVRANGPVDNSLHQAIVAFSWPVSERWSTLGAYSHNISKNYSMMSLFGVQYDNCCWAMRVLGGRTFKSLNAGFEPRYNNSVYLQILLKGLGTVANSDPNNILATYIPGYNDLFSR